MTRSRVALDDFDEIFEASAMTDDFPDLNQFVTFLCVVDQNGFQSAARFLGVSQPSVSQQIQRLEKKLGHRLFKRTGKSIALTADGEALVVFARAMQAVTARVRNYFNHPQADGTIRIGIHDDFARSALLKVLMLFARSHPRVEIAIQCHTSSDFLFRSVDDGHLDLVIARCAVGQSRGVLVWTEQMVWIGNQNMIDLVEDPVPLVLPPRPSFSRDLAISVLNDAGRAWRVRFESGSVSSLEVAVQAGIGVCIAMESLEIDVRKLGVESGLPPLPVASLFVDRRRDVKSPAIDGFEAIVIEAIRQIGRTDGGMGGSNGVRVDGASSEHDEAIAIKT